MVQGLELGGQVEGRARVLKPGGPWRSPLKLAFLSCMFLVFESAGGRWDLVGALAALLWLSWCPSARLCRPTAPLRAWKPAQGRPFQQLIIPRLM